MNPERLAWLFGSILCVFLASRLVGRVPVEEQDRQFANLVAQVQHEVRSRYVTEITPEKQKQMQLVAIQAMLNTLDPHTVYVPPIHKGQFMEVLTGNFVGIGVSYRANEAGEIEIITPLDGGPAYAAGIEAGDVITHVDGVAIQGMKTDEIAPRIKGPAGTKVKITVRRYDQSVRDFDIVRASVNEPTVIGYSRRADGSWDYFVDRSIGIAYVRIAQFNEDTLSHVETALRTIATEGAKGVIVDLRFNPGGRLEDAARIADLFLDEGLIVSVKGRTRPESQIYARAGDTIVRVPVAVLVNEESASASEIVAGALQDHRRAVVVGMRTYGKGSVQDLEDWGEDGALKITIAQYFLPSGRSVHRWENSTSWGVDPSVEVKLSKEEFETVGRALLGPSIIPPTSHATTRPARAKDRQLDAAVDAVAAMLMGSHRDDEARPSRDQ